MHQLHDALQYQVPLCNGQHITLLGTSAECCPEYTDQNLKLGSYKHNLHQFMSWQRREAAICALTVGKQLQVWVAVVCSAQIEALQQPSLW